MPDIRPPSWLELESIIPLEAEPGVTSVETITTLSAETQRREYPEFVIQLSPRRQGMKLKHALRIAGTADIEANPVPAKHERTKITASPKTDPARGWPVVNVQLKGGMKPRSALFPWTGKGASAAKPDGKRGTSELPRL